MSDRFTETGTAGRVSMLPQSLTPGCKHNTHAPRMRLSAIVLTIADQTSALGGMLLPGDVDCTQQLQLILCLAELSAHQESGDIVPESPLMAQHQ